MTEKHGENPNSENTYSDTAPSRMELELTLYLLPENYPIIPEEAVQADTRKKSTEELATQPECP